MASLPEELKSIKPYLVRALEMEKANALVSYYTHLYAVQLALDYYKKSPSSQGVKQYLQQLMQETESKKASLSNTPNPKSAFENFVTQLFVSVDSEDRNSEATKSTAQKFLVCSYFIEAMNVFEEIPPDWEEKRLYCKWKASDILKCIKQGIKPKSGGPNEHADEEPQEPQEPQEPSEAYVSSKPPSLIPSSEKPEKIPSVPEKKQTSSREARQAIEQAKKLAKYAIQELEFKNIDNAISNFQSAIEALNNLK